MLLTDTIDKILEMDYTNNIKVLSSPPRRHGSKGFLYYGFTLSTERRDGLGTKILTTITMKLYEARQIAKELFEKHGLTGWTFKFDTSKRRFGVCKSKSQVISLSAKLTVLNDEAVVRNTILHEIAHALEPRAGHSIRWKVRAMSIGCEPNRTYGAEVVTPKANFTGTCPTCQRTIQRHRRTRIACSRCCVGGVFNPQHLFTWSLN